MRINIYIKNICIYIENIYIIILFNYFIIIFIYFLLFLIINIAIVCNFVLYFLQLLVKEFQFFSFLFFQFYFYGEFKAEFFFSAMFRIIINLQVLHYLISINPFFILILQLYEIILNCTLNFIIV